MKYHRTYLEYVDTVAYCNAPLLVQAVLAWLWVACARAENDGVFLGSKGWGTRQWSSLTNGQLARRHVELVVQHKLASWEGDHLRVHGYDLAGQQAYKKDRDRFTAYRLAEAGRTRAAPGDNPEPPWGAQAPSNLIGSDRIELNAQVGEERAAQASPDQGGKPPTRTRITKPIAAIRAAVAADDALALLRANGCRVDGKESEWLAAAAGMSVPALGTMLAWADGHDMPVVFPSNLTTARITWRDLPVERRREIGRHHAENLGTTALFAHESP